MNSFAGVLERG